MCEGIMFHFLSHRGLKASQATKQVNPTHQLQDFDVWHCIILVFIKKEKDNGNGK